MQLSFWTEARKSDYGQLFITAAQAVANCVTVALQGRRASAISNIGLFHLYATLIASYVRPFARTLIHLGTLTL
jgi:hypothetical protein